MMKKTLFYITLVCCVVALASCSSPQNLYSWYDYEDAVYKYNKTPTDEAQVKVLEQYKKLTEKQSGVRGMVPPGLYAEYGYLLFKTGKKDEGLSFLKQEIKLYPESERYISRIIKQIEK